MKFEFTFEVNPSSIFGVPEEGRIVVPANTKVNTPPIHFKTGITAGHSTLPKYREEDEALKLSIKLDNAHIQFNDNYLVVDIQANSLEEANAEVFLKLERFFQHLSITLRRSFTYKLLLVEFGSEVILPRQIIMKMNATSYDLEKLKHDIEQVSKYHHLGDEKLVRALQYYEYALLLFEKREAVADFASRHFTLLIAFVFLNLWKAISTIVGDPSVDKDYQSRYKKLGFDYGFFKNEIEKIRELRNDYDVSHYSLDEKAIKEVERNFQHAANVASTVLAKYRDHLVQQVP